MFFAFFVSLKNILQNNAYIEYRLPKLKQKIIEGLWKTTNL